MYELMRPQWQQFPLCSKPGTIFGEMGIEIDAKMNLNMDSSCLSITHCDTIKSSEPAQSA